MFCLRFKNFQRICARIAVNAKDARGVALLIMRTMSWTKMGIRHCEVIMWSCELIEHSEVK